MGKLIGKSTGDQVVEYYGPITGRNYNTAGAAAPAAPEINVVVRGSGSIQLQETQTFIIKGNAGPNTFTTDRVADPTTWTNIGTVIDASSGLVTVTPTVAFPFTSIRAVVVDEGTGDATIQSDWN